MAGSFSVKVFAVRHRPTEVHLAGNDITETVLVDGTVRRRTGAWTPAVHALLRHLARKGFPAPRVLGFDASGREVLSYIPGSHSVDPQPVARALLTDSGVEQAARLLRVYHDAVRDFEPGPDLRWRSGARGLDGQQLICHGDPGPWNVIWNRDRVAGLIDFDLAEPGRAAFDVGFALWFFVPFRPDREVDRIFGPRLGLDRNARARRFLDAYGWTDATPAADLVLALQDREHAIRKMRARAGLEPWATFVARGLNRRNRAHHSWLLENRSAFD